MNADVHAVPPAGRTNSPRMVNSRPRALAEPAACRRDSVGVVPRAALGEVGAAVMATILGERRICYELLTASQSNVACSGMADQQLPAVEFRVDPSAYRHWRLDLDGPVATLAMDVDEQGGLVPGYELKLNSYDLGVDIELYDAVQRLRFEHPEVRTVVLTSGKDKIFCAGANIRMLAASPHPWKVNFCKFTNETRNGIEDATANSGQTYVAALNGTASGGGYELALACEHIMLIDDRSSTVSLPELPLLGVLPGTGGLTRVVDKRFVRRDRADYFATKSEGLGGKKAAQWRLVDEVVPRAEVGRHRARAGRRAGRAVGAPRRRIGHRADAAGEGP